VSDWDEKLAQEAHDEAASMMEIELPSGVRLSALEGAPEAFDAGVWFGIAATLSTLQRNGIIQLGEDGESRE
jgi:hypothetical protein